MRGKSATFARVSAAVAGLLIAFWGPAMAYGDSFSFDFSTAGYTTSPDAEIVDLGAFFVARIKQRPDWIVGAHKRRVKITVENPGSLVTDYPIALGISSHSKQELFNFIQELSGGDLVVTTSDGQTQLPTWVEELRDESSPISCPNASRVITGLTPVSEPVTTLDTKSLVYRVDEIQYSVTFAGTSLSLDDLVMQINSHGGPLRARRFGQRIQLLPPPGFQPYDFHFEIVSGTDAAAVLGVAIGEYSTDDVDPVTNGMFLPCAVIWFRAPQLSTGITSFFLYFDDFTAGPPDPLSGEDVFSSSTRRGTHVLLSDRQSAANLQLASFTFGADTRIETSSLFLETFIDFDQFVVVPPAYTSLASIVSSTRPLAGLYDMPSGDALQPLMTASREFHFPVLGSPAKDDTIFIYASEADVRVELEEWTFNIGSQTSTKVKNQTVDLTQFQHQSVNFDPGPNSVVTLRTSCPPATPPPCTPPRVVAFYRAAQTGNFVDGMPMLPPATDLWGIRGAELGLNAGHQLTPTITGIGPTTIVKRYLSDSSVTTYNLRVGAVVNENDPP
ncbi:MAG: hypothetical protein KC609_01600, partial [Myxococcales bacterium]|nr:hypothetical protein [Myxococcales bacterium]